MTAYRYLILGWDDHFETSATRKLHRLQWVSVPTKQSGKGFTRIMAQEDGAAIFGIWVLIVQACAAHRLPRAGWLTDDGTKESPAWSIDDLAERWRRTPAEIARALDVLCSPKVSWMAAYDISADNLPITSHSSATVEGEVREKSGRGGAAAPPPPASPAQDRDERRRLVRARLAQLRFASDDTALEEWCGLLMLEAKCRDLAESLECLKTLKNAGKREGITSRYAREYEGLAQRWHLTAHRKPPAEEPA